MINDEQRTARLVGGNGEDGGGIPLPPVFGAILEYLAGDRAATFAELSEVVKSALEYKKARVFATWPNWKSVTSDLLMQLDAENFIRQPEPGFYRRTVKVKHGESLLIIPSAGIRVTVYDAGHREIRDNLSEVLSTAARHGLGDGDTDLLLRRLEDSLTGTGVKTRAAHAGSLARLEDQPGVFRMCTRCGDDFELTEENFSVFKSHGEYYRNRLHVQCRRDLDEEKRAEKRKTAQVKRDLEKLLNTAAAPSVADVMKRSGIDAYLARRYWDELAALGKVPDRARAWK